ncbi:hypothetical protein D3C78_951460 [compost metagenome]
MQRGGHVDAGEVVVRALESYVPGAGVGADAAQKIGKAHATPLADGTPAFDTDMPGDLVYLRHGAQLGQRPGTPVGDHAGHFQPVAGFVDDAHFVFVVVGIEGKGAGDLGIGIGRCQLRGAEDQALHRVVETRDPGQRGFDLGVVAEAAAGEQRQAAERERALQKGAACGLGQLLANQ